MTDIQLRKEVKLSVLEKFKKDGSRIIDELGILWGDAFVDIAVINGHLHAYELKSEVDNLARLPNQIEAYNQVFDFLTIVISEKHYKKFQKQFKASTKKWGVYIAKSSGKQSIQLELVKEAEKNTTNLFSVCHLLWRDEVLSLIEEFRFVSSGLTRKPKKALYQFLTDNVGSKTLKREVRETIKRRKDWRVG